MARTAPDTALVATDSLRIHVGLLELIRSDILRSASQAAAFQESRPGLLRTISLLAAPSGSCCALYRVSHALHCRGWLRLAILIAWINLVLYRALIEPGAKIGPGLYIPHTPGVVFRGHAGQNLCLFTKALVAPADAPFFGMPANACPELGDDVNVGAFGIVSGPVKIGNGVQIGPCAVVRSDISPGAVVLAPYLHARPPRAAASANARSDRNAEQT